MASKRDASRGDGSVTRIVGNVLLGLLTLAVLALVVYLVANPPGALH